MYKAQDSSNSCVKKYMLIKKTYILKRRDWLIVFMP